jgi:hypothetical protein
VIEKLKHIISHISLTIPILVTNGGIMFGQFKIKFHFLCLQSSKHKYNMSFAKSLAVDVFLQFNAKNMNNIIKLHHINKT